MDSPFDISARLVDDLVELSPTFGTAIGAAGGDSEWDDLSPEGWQARADLARGVVTAMAPHLDHPDRAQRLAAHVVSEFAGYTIDDFEALDHLRALSHMASPFQAFREIFELIDHTVETSAHDAAARLETIEHPLAGYRETLRLGVESGEVTTRRQCEAVLAQIDRLAGPASAWNLLVVDSPIPERMTAAVATAQAAMAEFGICLRNEYLPEAKVEDGVGREVYERAARSFLGMAVDADEMYEWGWSEIDRLLTQMRTVAGQIDPSLPLQDVIDLMETDPSLSIDGRDRFVDFVKARQDRAIADLDATHFDLADEIRTVTVGIAPPGGALGAYYRQPSEDFSRPGGIYYSVGDRHVFPLYQEVSTAYHEGFPGHHLQIGTTTAARERLSRAQRVLIWYSGYGEGWAMYAERLMDELGYFERPEWVFGMLASQLFRASRVVTDIGLHLGLDVPEGAPLHAGERWSFDSAVAFIHRVGLQPLGYAESEVLRYLGWPGQAISYKIGEREILELRESERRRLGEAFDLKAFHSRVLGSGEMGLELLATVVSEDFDA